MSTHTITLPDIQYGVTTDYDYSADRKRQYIDVWSGPWMHSHEGRGVSRKHGFTITTYNDDVIHVDCPSPRTEDNYQAVDRAIATALNEHRNSVWIEYALSRINN